MQITASNQVTNKTLKFSTTIKVKTKSNYRVKGAFNQTYFLAPEAPTPLFSVKEMCFYSYGVCTLRDFSDLYLT